MATTPKLSKEFSLMFGGYAIAKATDFSMSINKETVDVTTLDSAGWKEKLVDLKEWSFSFSGLVVRGAKDGLSDWLTGSTYAADDIVTNPDDNFIYISQQAGNIGHDPDTDDGTWWKKYLTDFSQLLEDLKESDTALAFALTTELVGDYYQAGTGFLVSLELSGSTGDKVSYSGSMEGTEAMTTTLIS